MKSLRALGGAIRLLAKECRETWVRVLERVEEELHSSYQPRVELGGGGHFKPMEAQQLTTK